MSDFNGQPRWGGESRARAPEPVLYAGFWRRVGATIIDGIILWLPTVFAWKALGLDPYRGYRVDMTPAEARIWLDMMTPELWRAAIVTAFIHWTYSAVMESSSRQATVGKMTFGLKVCDQGGNRISFARATGRFFAEYLSGLILCIGYMMAGFTEKKQALHDMIASTLVTRSDPFAERPTRE